MNPKAAKVAGRNTSGYSALQRREAERRPIRVAVVGAGATGRAIALQLGTPVPGIRLAGMANRTPMHAERAFREAGNRGWQAAETASDPEGRISKRVSVITYEPPVLAPCHAAGPILASHS